MEVPDWAHANLSRDLPLIRSRGEGQDLEFKAEFPSNTRELGKEIAAFATSNTGTILIGVADTGDLVGLSECDTPDGRDRLIRRLEGISTGTVKPSITPTAKFAIEGDAIVLVVTVPKGSQPIYYSNNIPYVRHLTQARPAEPHEVIDYITSYNRDNSIVFQNDDNLEKAQFYSSMINVLTDILVIADESDERLINPWLDMWLSELEYAASELRDLAVTIFANNEGIAPKLQDLSKKLDIIANSRFHIGSDGDLKPRIIEIVEAVKEIAYEHISSFQLSETTLNQVKELIRTTALKVKSLHERAESMVDSGRIEELQSEASNLARPLTRAARYNIDTLGKGIKEDLLVVSRTLHLTETMRIRMDGGRSVDAIIDRIGDCANKLIDITNRLQ